MRKQKAPKPTFQSYLGSNGNIVGSTSSGSRSSDPQSDLESSMECRPVFEDLEPKYLPGEVLVSQAKQVLKFMPYSDQKQGTSGSLFVTNFKISFLSGNASAESSNYSPQRHKLIGEDDIILNNIHSVYQVSRGRRRKLLPGLTITGHVKNIEIHCKDFRIHNYTLKFASKTEAKNTVNAIVHHAFPTRLELLFAFEYKGPTAPTLTEPQTPLYETQIEWEAELSRLKVMGFKAVLCNEAYRMSQSMPQCIVIPSSLRIADVTSAAPIYRESRCPMWSYTYSNGSSLVRMAYLLPDCEDKSSDSTIVNGVLQSHPARHSPKTYDLTKLLPSLNEVQTSYEKLRELCMPVSLKEVWSSDESWFSDLESTKWHSHVASALQMALCIADVMTVERNSVIIREMESSDWSPLVASLVQLLLDQHCTTIAGFQCLVQREWVAMGHKFSTRMGLGSSDKSEECPLFLLFLDCVWQLLQQFPSNYQFSEVYLTRLWDCVCVGLFENFIFNNSHHRWNKKAQYPTKHITFLSVWDWTKQFSKEDMSLFNNPLYLAKSELNLQLTESKRTQVTPRNKRALKNKLYAMKLSGMWDKLQQPTVDNIRPVVSAPLIKFWSHCYLRWLTPVQILAGGTPSEYLQQCMLVEEIMILQHKIRSIEKPDRYDKTSRPKSDLFFGFHFQDIPKERWTDSLTSSFPFVPARPPSACFFGTPLRAYFKSFISVSDDESVDGQSDTDLKSVSESPRTSNDSYNYQPECIV